MGGSFGLRHFPHRRPSGRAALRLVGKPG